MNFPNTIEIIKQFNFFLLTGPGAVVTGIIFLIVSFIKFRNRNIPNKISSRIKWPQALILALALLLIGSVHSCVYESVDVALDFQNVELADVDGLIIEQVHDPKGNPFKTVTIRDIDYLRNGLKTLNLSKSYSRNHEAFLNGYRIQLIIMGKNSSKYISAYRDSDRLGEVNVVIPHYGKNPSGDVAFQGGIYQCKEFIKWIDKAIKKSDKRN
jgi:hypothetical protein